MIGVDTDKVVWELENTARDFKGTSRQKVIQAEKQFLERVKEVIKDNREDIIKTIEEENKED